MLGQQGAHVVASEGEQGAACVPGHDGQAVGVRVVGDGEVGAGALGQRHHPVHRARLLGVGKANGGEGAVRFGLLGDGMQRDLGGSLHGRQGEPLAHAVERRVGDGEGRAALGAHEEVGHTGQVGLERLGPEPPEQAAGLGIGVVEPGQGGVGAHFVDVACDGGVDGGNDLRGVLPEDLVAVVLGWVVARRDHHAGRGAELLAGEAHQGGRERLGIGVDGKAGAGGQAPYLAGEGGAAPPTVVADHDAALGCPGHEFAESLEQAGGGAGDDEPVHPGRAGTEQPAQPCRAEAQGAGEAVGERRDVVTGEQLAQLASRLGIRVVGHPGLDPCSQVRVHHDPAA